MNKKTNKFVIIFCILMMALPFFSFNVGATDIKLEDWDSYNVGATSGSSTRISWEQTAGDDFMIVDTTEKTVKSTPNCLRVNNDDVGGTTGYINITSPDYYADSLEIHLRMESKSFSKNHIQYINFYDAEDNIVVQLRMYNKGGTTNDDGLSYYHATSGWVELIAFTSPDNANWIYIIRENNTLHGNGCDYNIKRGAVWTNVTSIISTTEDWSDIAYLKLWNTGEGDTSHSGYIDVWVDDIIFPEYTSPEYEGEFDFDATDNIGNLDTTTTIGLSSKDIEFMYFVPVTINATGFDLVVDSAMHYWDDVLSNYVLYINGNYMNTPSEWKKYGNNYVLRWEFITPIVIENSVILFELWHDVDIAVGTTPIYWNVGIGVNRQDMDDDWVINMRHSNTYPNGVHDGTRLLRDVAYQLYFDSFTFIEDEIDVTYNSITTIDGSYYVGDPVPLTYMLQTSNMIYDNYVKIWNDDTSTEITIDSKQGFPYLCMYQLETIGFVPFVSANYTAQLYINGANATNVSFFVNDRINSDMYVFTYPNPSKVGQEIRVEYNYDHPSDKDGAIFLCRSPNLNNYISVNHLSDGDSGFWSETHNIEGTYYYILAVDITGNGTYGIVSNGIHPHRVVSEQGNNYFKLGSDNLRLNVEGTATQTVTGECNMISGNCFIYDNNKLIKTITESSFSYSYDLYTAGLHTVEMRLITNVTTVLFRQNYSVSTFTDEPEIEDTSYIVRDWVYDMYGDIGVFIAGVCVVLGFMFIPFALVLGVNVKYNKNIALGDMHWSIYLIFAIVGVIVDVQLHLAELWIILLICVVSIAIAVITWNGNR